MHCSGSKKTLSDLEAGGEMENVLGRHMMAALCVVYSVIFELSLVIPFMLWIFV